MKCKTFFLVALSFVAFSCTKKDEVVTAAAAAGVGTHFTNITARPIFDKCSKCHLQASGNAPALARFVYNPLNYEASIKANIGKIYPAINVFGKGMAGENFGDLSQAEVNSIIAWYKAGYPAK